MKREDSLGTDRLGGGRMFDAIAGRYDMMNRILSLGIDKGWRRAAVRALALSGHDGARVLDVATGTGDLAIAIAEALPGCKVVGVDPSAGMLEVGAQKVERRGLSERVTLEVGQAESLPFPDASFDGATIAFGIRNVEDRPRGLAELARVTRPGGKVVVLELSEPRGGFMSTIARVHVHHMVPFLGGLLSGRKEYGYLQKSIAAFPPPETFSEMMGAAGLVEVEATPLTMGVAHLFVGVRAEASRS